VAEPAGYSGAPLAKKLGIKDGGELALLDAPLSWSVPELPDGVTVARASAEKRRQGGGQTLARGDLADG
jgi:hypothetical protein